MNKAKQNYDGLSLVQKIRLVEQLIVIHPQMQAILDKMDYCREHAKFARESVGLLVTGEKGTGKTTIKDIYLSRNRVRQTKTATIVPVLSISIPVPASERALTVTLLTALNDPYPARGTIAIQTLRVYKLVERCKVELSIFDEFQHFAERESFKLNRTVSDWTKNYMVGAKMPLILFGTPKSAEILNGEENDQLRRRFPYRISLKSFTWETDEDQLDFRKFLGIIDEQLPFKARSKLADPYTASLIHFSTGGVMFEIMRLIRWAAVAALRRGLPKIDLELLSQSFVENIATNSPERKNPFQQ
jgi:hypothetical protein